MKYSNCPKYYIGQKGRSFKQRFQNLINTLISKSSFAEHQMMKTIPTRV